MSPLQTYLAIAYPVLAAVIAVGILIFIKIVRHRQAAKDPRRLEAVPARPMSHEQARRLARRYFAGAALVVLLLAAGGLIVA